MSADDCPDCEDFLADNNRLRAEVERLTQQIESEIGPEYVRLDLAQKWLRERDEALAQVQKLEMELTGAMRPWHESCRRRELELSAQVLGGGEED